MLQWKKKNSEMPADAGENRAGRKRFHSRETGIGGMSMKGKRKLFGVVLLFLCVLLGQRMSADAASRTPVATHGRLAVKGTNLVDAKGKKFQLRGISTHGINWDVGAPFVNKAAFQTLRDDWGANAVRLAMYTAEYNGYCSGGNKNTLKNRIYNGVKYATDLGMYVVIDWHILNDGNPKTHLKDAKSFFAAMSRKYRNQKNVIYEICNEPNGCSWKTIKSYAEPVIREIRKNDPNAVIIVGTPTWSQLGNDVIKNPLKGYKNIMYALHFYANESSHNRYLPSKLNTARKKGLPVIVSEFGLSAASGNGGISTRSADQWMKRLDNANISYFCWSLSNKNESCSLLSSRTKKRSNWKTSELSSAGKYIRNKYRARKRTLGSNS